MGLEPLQQLFGNTNKMGSDSKYSVIAAYSVIKKAIEFVKSNVAIAVGIGGGETPAGSETAPVGSEEIEGRFQFQPRKSAVAVFVVLQENSPQLLSGERNWRSLVIAEAAAEEIPHRHTLI